MPTSKSEKELLVTNTGNGTAPEDSEQLLPALDDMTPREIVAELDKYIVGQAAAKRAVAVALRNRVRRQKLPPEIAEDVLQPFRALPLEERLADAREVNDDVRS